MGLLIKALLVSFLPSLFAGAVMISIALGSLLPQIDSIIHPLLAIKGDKIIIEKQDYSHVPGETIIVIRHLLVYPQGNKKDITFRVGVYASLLYTASLMLLSLITAFVYTRSRHWPLTELVKASAFASVLLALIISGLVTLVAIGFFINFLIEVMRASW